MQSPGKSRIFQVNKLLAVKSGPAVTVATQAPVEAQGADATPGPAPRRGQSHVPPRALPAALSALLGPAAPTQCCASAETGQLFLQLNQSGK